VPLKTIDPVYYDKAYYLGPDKGGAKPYALLAQALRASGRCALGRWAARGKQHLVMIRPVEGGLVMQQLLYGAEVRSIKEIDIPPTEVKDAELKLAQQLIDSQAVDRFDPAAYTDAVHARIEAAVQKKVEGQEITLAEEGEGGGQVIDLMEALRASLEKKAPAASPVSSSPPQAEARKPPKRAQAAAEPTVRKAAKK
jgi:DNA end-binding protein Ku